MECICQSLSLIINFCHSEQGNISAPDPLWFDLPRHLGDRQSSPSFRSHSQHFAGSARGNQWWYPLIPTGCTRGCAGARWLPRHRLQEGPPLGPLGWGCSCSLIIEEGRFFLSRPLAEPGPKCQSRPIWRVFASSCHLGSGDYQPSSHWLYSYDLFSTLLIWELEMSTWIIN